MRFTTRLFAFCAICTVAAPVAAQSTPAPTAYTVKETQSIFTPNVSMTIYRDGSKALVDQSTPPGGGSPKGVHTRTLYDLQKHTTLSWDLNLSPLTCSPGTFSGDWGDPFAMSAEIASDLAKNHPREIGAETIAGVSTKKLEAAMPGGGGTATVWTAANGLVIKMVLAPPTGAVQAMVDVQQLTLGAPPASAFALPPGCAGVPTPSPAPTGPPAGFSDALMPPPSQNSCSVLFRVVRSGSMETITSGYQVAADLTVDLEHPAHYVMGAGPGGRRTFSGGGLHELTPQLKDGVLRLDAVPAQFDLELAFGSSGDSSALIYRHCAGPQTELLFVVRNPARLSDGGDWLWKQ